MTGETGILKKPTEVLALPLLPPARPRTKIDEANEMFRVAVMHKMTIGDMDERARVKKEASKLLYPDDEPEEREKKIGNLDEAITTTRSLCSKDEQNAKYIKNLAVLMETSVAIGELAYWANSLEAAKIAAQEACEMEATSMAILGKYENDRAYRKYLAFRQLLDEMEI
jgi:hypothetical protein